MPDPHRETTGTESQASLVFAKYQILRRLAVGGMGEVFLARQVGVQGFERLVILKSLLPDLAADPNFVQSFLDEARVAATLNHPNVVSIFEVGLWEGAYFIAMEYIDGSNLGDLRRTTQPKGVPVHVATRVIRDAAFGLDHAHHAVDVRGQPLSIVHRDVSPQNIMVRRDGVTKVVDFGIAHASGRSSRTRTGAVKGKLSYMSPEQLLGKEVDARADQFALGIVLWELLANRRLFKADGDLEVMQQVLKAEIPPPSSVAPGLPPGLDEVVMKMLSREPHRRFPQLGDVGAELDAVVDVSSPRLTGERRIADFLKTLPAEGERVPGPAPANFVIALHSTPSRPGIATSRSGPMATGSAQHTAVLPRRRRWLLGAGAAVAVGLVAVLALALRSPPAVSPPSAEEPKPAVIATPVPKPPAAKGPQLTVVSEPAGAAAQLDDAPLGPAPQTVSTTPGKHLLRLTLTGYQPAEMPVELKEGDSRELFVPLVRTS
ncbi:MAG TPA: protein kinase, partial [Myxococcaceae bacterium]|nr:protein kinase [Myxococcaceae bacterium]